MNKDMEVGRWYPSVATAPDGRLLIMSGHTDQGWGTSTSVIERFPAKSHPVPFEKTVIPRDVPTDTLRVDAPFGADSDYPHLFTLRDGKVYGLGRHATRQWAFDPVAETRTDLPARPDGVHRGYGSAVPLPAGLRGPDSVLVLGGDRDDPNTYRLTSGGAWEKQQPRAFGRTQDDTLLLPDASLLTVNGAYGIRDYGNGDYNPKSDLKYRQIETRNALGEWKLGPAQRLPRGYHSNAVVLPDGRVMVTGDELQQLANDPKIDDDMNGSIEIFEPSYLHRGNRPVLDYALRDRCGTTPPSRWGPPRPTGSRRPSCWPRPPRRTRSTPASATWSWASCTARGTSCACRHRPRPMTSRPATTCSSCWTSTGCRARPSGSPSGNRRTHHSPASQPRARRPGAALCPRSWAAERGRQRWRSAFWASTYLSMRRAKSMRSRSVQSAVTYSKAARWCRRKRSIMSRPSGLR